MVKHNNLCQNIHFRKDWQRFVKVNFNQAARKKKRHMLRKQRAAAGYIGLLRPVVRPPTIKYNCKTRLGRGFTYEELKAAGLSRVGAKRFHVAYDKRRVNRSEGTFKANVQRIKDYIAKVVVTNDKNQKRISQEAMLENVGEGVPAKQAVAKTQEIELTTAMQLFEAHAKLREQYIATRPQKEKDDGKKKKKKGKK